MQKQAFYLFILLSIILFIQPTLQDYCDDNCATCESDTVCEECEEGLQREIVDGICVCEEGFFENARGLCESENQTSNYILLVFVIFFIIIFFVYIFNIHKSNPLRFCSLLQLKHHPIPVPQHEFSKSIHPINFNLQQDTSQQLNMTSNNQFETTNKSLIPRDHDEEGNHKFRIVKDSKGLNINSQTQKPRDLDDLNTNAKSNNNLIGAYDDHNEQITPQKKNITIGNTNSSQLYSNKTQNQIQNSQQHLNIKQKNKNYQPDSFRIRENQFDISQNINNEDNDNAVSIHSDWDDDDDDDEDEEDE